uniref:Pop-1 n=1 Tax=Pristionchus pacificus TaxID=54126 RepID=A0A8R1UTZ0_PRIPA
MADETDEVKVFRVQHEDESDAPSLADDKKDVALEEEMESKPGAFGKGFQPAMPSSPSFATIFPIPSPGAFYQQYALMNQAMMLNTAQQYIRSLSPAYPPPGQSPFDMYRNALIAAVSPSAPKIGMMGVPLPASHRHNPLNQIQMMNSLHSISGASTSSTPHHPAPKRVKKEKEEHIKVPYVKKPMNAFMWFMKENRPKIMEEEEWKDKQSAELNKELGSRWQKLDKDEQKKYYEMATKDKEDHNKKYPNWTARENYASNKKKKKKRDRTIDSNESKKCRARFGMNAQDKWCKHCVRKKKCLYTTGDDEERSSSHQRASDSESDLDDDPTLSLRDMEGDGVKMEVTDPINDPSSFAFNPLFMR